MATKGKKSGGGSGGGGGGGGAAKAPSAPAAPAAPAAPRAPAPAATQNRPATAGARPVATIGTPPRGPGQSANTAKVNDRLAQAQYQAERGNLAEAARLAQSASQFSRSGASNANIAKIVSAYSAQAGRIEAERGRGPDLGNDVNLGEIPNVPGREYEEVPVETMGFDPMAGYYAEQDRLRSMNLIATLRGVMETYGLTSLMGKIEQYVRDGYDGDAVLALIRQTPEYDARFPAMKTLAGKQRAISEAEYIAYERRASELERAYGMPSGMLDKTAVTRLIGNEVSAAELEQRLTLAAAGAYQTAPQVRQQFEQYYGIGSGGLTAYFLDPDKAAPLLNKQFVSAQIGAEAAMQGVGIGVEMAQSLQEQGVTEAAAREGFQRVASMSGLASGRGDVVSQRQLIEGNLLQNAEAQGEIERAAATRRGRFEVGGGLVGTERGIQGLGSAAT